MSQENLVITAKRYNQAPSIQRLGSILGEISDQKVSALLLAYLKTVKHCPVLIRSQKEKPDTMAAGNAVECWSSPTKKRYGSVFSVYRLGQLSDITHWNGV
jgi:hypothetical protein